jgi:uncharacterized protein YggE
MKKIILVGVIALIGLYLVPWNKFGKNDNVTVTGVAKTVVKNQLASFYAGVMANSDSKDTAVNEVNTKSAVLVKAVKDFGIEDKDIKTQNLSVYQDKLSKIGQWSANNSIEITLRNVDRAAELTDLLNKTPANNVSGPNFSVDDTSSAEKSLYDIAMKDAKDKAELIAKASGRTVGKVMVVVDGGSTSGIVYPMMDKASGMGGGASVESGSANVSKSLTVTFELK